MKQCFRWEFDREQNKFIGKLIMDFRKDVSSINEDKSMQTGRDLNTGHSNRLSINGAIPAE